VSRQWTCDVKLFLVLARPPTKQFRPNNRVHSAAACQSLCLAIQPGRNSNGCRALRMSHAVHLILTVGYTTAAEVWHTRAVWAAYQMEWGSASCMMAWLNLALAAIVPCNRQVSWQNVAKRCRTSMH